MTKANDFTREEVDTIYVDPTDRFIVSLIVGYGGDYGDGVTTPQLAAAAALNLTNDMGANGTVWHVRDRKTGLTHRFEQGDFEDEEVL